MMRRVHLFVLAALGCAPATHAPPAPAPTTGPTARAPAESLATESCTTDIALTEIDALRRAGKLDRARWRLRRSAERCPAFASRHRALADAIDSELASPAPRTSNPAAARELSAKAEASGELGQHESALALALEAAAQTEHPGYAFWLAATLAGKLGRPVERQRYLDRALAAFERTHGVSATLEAPDDFGDARASADFLEWTATGQLALASGSDVTVMMALEARETFHDPNGRSVAASNAGLLAIGGHDSVVRLIDERGGHVERRFTAAHAGVWNVELSDDAKTLLAESGEIAIGLGTVQVWDASTGTLRWRRDCHPECGHSLSPDGSVVVGRRGGRLEIIDALSGKTRHTHALQGDFSQAEGWRYGFASDGSLIVADEGNVRRIHPRTGRSTRMGTALPPDSAVLTIDPERPRLLLALPTDADASDRPAAWWDGKSLEHVAASYCTRAIATKRSGGKLGACPATWYSYLLQDMTDSVKARRFSRGVSRVNGLAFSARGRRLWVALGDERSMDHHGVAVWDLERGSLESPIPGKQEPITHVASGGERIAFAALDGTIGIAGPDRDVDYPRGLGQRLTALALSPDGRRLVWAHGSDGDLGMRVSSDGATEIRALSGHTTAVTEAVFSSDGSRLFTGSTEPSIIEWDMKSSEPVRTLRDGDEAISALAVSNDMVWLATAAGTVVRLHDRSGKHPIRTLGRAALPVSALVFSRDGKRLFVARAHRIEVWDTQSGRALAHWVAPGSGIWSRTVSHLALSAEGARLAASAGPDVHVFNAHTGAFLATLTAVAGGRAGVARAPDGGAEIFGDALPHLTCRIGKMRLPAELCVERFREQAVARRAR